MIASMMGKVRSRERVTIPIELRRKYNLRSGTKLIAHKVNDQIVVMTMEQQMRSQRWKYKSKGSMKALRQDRREEGEL